MTMDRSPWGDVRGDYEAARRAATAMRRAAAALEQARFRREAIATVARDGWSGHFAARFDARLAAAQRESADLQAALIAAARRLDLGADDAAIDQRARTLAGERSSRTILPTTCAKSLHN
ncbi:MAG: hypothetical protein ABR598_03225 [Candidatus Dormibacteria bacterium]